MEEKDFKELMDKFKVESQDFIKGLIQESTDKLITSEQLEAQLKTLSDDGGAIKELKDAIEAQGLEMRKLVETKEEHPKTMKEILKSKHADIIKALDNPNGKFDLPINKTTVSMSSFTNDPAGMILPGFAEIQTQRNVIAQSLNTFPMGPDSHGIVRWTDWTTATSGAAARADGAAAGESTAAWTGYSASLESISDSIPVHLEALRDVAVMEAELNNFLTNNIAVKEDNYLYSGTGTTPQIKGLYTYSTAFDAAAYIAAGGYAPKSANLYDLVVAMAAQIMKASKYNVDVVYLNPYDTLKMKLNKDANGNYLLPPFAVNGAGGTFMVDNIRVVSSNSVTVNTCVIGDSAYARRYVGENINLSFGYNSSGDFTKRIITILGNMAELLLIRNAEVDAFLKSTDLESDIAAITTATA